jgi:hypothetical protein
MWTKLRVWWYRNTDAKHMPMDVREYFIRKALKEGSAEAKTPEQKNKFFAMVMSYVHVPGDPPLSETIQDEMVAAAYKILDDLSGPCAKCRKWIEFHKATSIDGVSFCDACYNSAWPERPRKH